MLTDQELIDLWNNGESEFVEFKPSASDKADIYHDICAFSNDVNGSGRTGAIFIGLNDDGTVTGINITDRLIRELALIRMQPHVQPMPDMAVNKHVLNGAELAVIQVRPSDLAPVKYSGRTCIRVGTVRHTASPEQDDRLSERRRAKNLPFDVQPASGVSLADLDLQYFEQVYLPLAFAPDVIEANKRTLEQKLASLRFVVAPTDPLPTVLGTLVLGLDPTYAIPGARIELLRIDGTKLSDPVVASLKISGRLQDLLQQLDEVLKLNIRTSVDIRTGAREVSKPDYPLIALQQLTRNAVMHRNYRGTHAPIRILWFDDRVEIHSPGGPFGRVNVANYGHPGVTDYRNPSLADAMVTLGYARAYGLGLETARDALAQNGNAPMEVTATPDNILTILRPA